MNRRLLVSLIAVAAFALTSIVAADGKKLFSKPDETPSPASKSVPAGRRVPHRGHREHRRSSRRRGRARRSQQQTPQPRAEAKKNLGASSSLLGLMTVCIFTLKTRRVNKERTFVTLLVTTSRRTAIPASCPADNSSAWRSPAHWRCDRTSCCSTK